MPIDVGSQTLSLKYGASGNSREINERFVDVRPPGIYEGGYLSLVDASNARLSPLVCEIGDGTHQLRIETTTNVTVAVASATPYVILRWSYTADALDYMQVMAVASGSILTTDVVVGLCTFTGGGALNGFSYVGRTNPAVMNLFLKVVPSEDSELKVRVRGGRIQNGKQYINIPDQKSSLFTAPASNSRIDLLYLNRSTGAVSILQGTAAASPVAPSYGGKLVLAEVTIAAGATNIVASNIQDVRDFTNMSYDVDGTTIEVDSNGKLAAKASVLGQSDVVIASSQIVATTSYALASGMTINMTTTGGTLIIGFSADVSLDASQIVYVELRIDSAAIVSKRVQFGPFGNNTTTITPITLSHLDKGLSAGAHTIQIFWKVSGGTAYMNRDSGSHRELWVTELPHSS
jgi:hypothetical protein